MDMHNEVETNVERWKADRDSKETPEHSEMKIADERGDIKKRGSSKLGRIEQQPEINIPLEPPKKKENARHAVGKTLSKVEMTKMEKIIYEREVQEKEKATSSKHEYVPTDESAELQEMSNPFRMIGQRSSHTNLKDLLEQCPIPQPPLTHKHLKTLQLTEDQALLMAEQIGKMKSGIERLQEIVTKFNCAERFKQDIDFLVENIGPAITKFEAERAAEQAQEKAKGKVEKPPDVIIANEKGEQEIVRTKEELDEEEKKKKENDEKGDN